LSEPIFYRRPVALARAVHGALRYAPPAGGYGFARAGNSVPLGAAEFEAAARHFPIAISAREPAGAIAILGLETGRNLFVGPDGAWLPGAYIPAYVRNYPFGLAAAGERMVLCIDEAAGCLGETGEALYEGDAPSAFATRTLQFAHEFQIEADRARAFADACAAENLLDEKRAEIALKDGRKSTLTGFRVLDRARFDALPEDTFLDWRRRGFLKLAYAHFHSMQAWGALADLAAAR
jgi:hypothetical protein